MSEVLLEVEDLQSHFGLVKAVDGVSFKLYKGETLGLVGESGCGKTTLGRTILKLIPSTAGKVFFYASLREGDTPSKFEVSHGRVINQFRKNMQIVFQDPASSLNPRLTINDIVAEPLKHFKLAKGEALHHKILDLLIHVGLGADHLWRYPYELSGGQRQRVAIARAIATNPDFIVLDEPTSALDVSVQIKILNLLKTIQSELGISYLFITHDMGVIDYMCDRVAVMYLGKIVEISKKEVMFSKPLHPYTRALLSSVPSKDPRDRKLAKAEIITGEIESARNTPLGCAFHPRCKYAFKNCGFGTRDFVREYQNRFEELGINELRVKGDEELEIYLHQKNDKSADHLINEFTKRKESNEPLMQSIEKMYKEDSKILLKFYPIKSVEILELENHSVRCLLYDKKNHVEERS